MTFEDYMKAVIAYFQIGGVTWETSYWRVLQQNHNKLAQEIREQGVVPIDDGVNLAAFLYVAFENWEK